MTLFLSAQPAGALSTTTTTLPTGVCGDPAFVISIDDRGIGGTAVISASDALFILQVAVAARTCALCVCDVNASASVTASDALTVLQAAVGAPVELDCPSCGTTTTVPASTTTSTTSTTAPLPTTSTTSTTAPLPTTTSTTSTTLPSDTETQVFSNACVRVDLSQPFAGTTTVFTSGTAAVEIDRASIGDRDGDGLEELVAEMTEVFFSETGTSVGNITVELADPSIHASLDRRTLGLIEEKVNGTPGTLDLVPYAAAGAAEVSFSMYLQAVVSGGLFNGRAHNDVPLEVLGTFTNSPPLAGDVLELQNETDIPLLADNDTSFLGVVIDTENGATLELAADDCGTP